jgi:hypothetical protein
MQAAACSLARSLPVVLLVSALAVVSPAREAQAELLESLRFPSVEFLLLALLPPQPQARSRQRLAGLRSLPHHRHQALRRLYSLQPFHPL